MRLLNALVFAIGKEVFDVYLFDGLEDDYSFLVASDFVQFVNYCLVFLAFLLHGFDTLPEPFDCSYGVSEFFFMDFIQAIKAARYSFVVVCELLVLVFGVSEFLFEVFVILFEAVDDQLSVFPVYIFWDVVDFVVASN